MSTSSRKPEAVSVSARWWIATLRQSLWEPEIADGSMTRWDLVDTWDKSLSLHGGVQNERMRPWLPGSAVGLARHPSDGSSHVGWENGRCDQHAGIYLAVRLIQSVGLRPFWASVGNAIRDANS